MGAMLARGMAGLRRLRHPAVASLALYAMAIGLASGSNFLTAPLLLSLLGPEGLARWGLIEPLILALLPVAGFGINFGIMHLLAGDGAPRRVIGRLWRYQMLAVLPVALVAAAFAAHWWSDRVALLVGGILLVEGAITLFVAYWRSCNQPVRFAAVEGGRAALVVALLAAAGVLLPRVIGRVEDYMALRFAVGALALAAGFAMVRPVGRSDREALRTAVHFGLPIVLASMLVALTTTIDRYAFAGASALVLGGYVAHVKIIQILGSALAPFFTWFAPVAMRRLREGEAAHPFFVGSAYAFYCVNAALTLLLWFAAPILWRLLFHGLAFDAPLFAVLLLGQAIFSLGNPVSIGTLREGRTWLALVATGVTLVVTAAGCFLLGHLFGAMGVAIGRFLGMASYTGMLALVTVRDLYIRYGWWRFGVVTLLTGAVMAATSLSPDRSLLTAIGLSVIALLLLAGVGWAFRPRGGSKRSG